MQAKGLNDGDKIMARVISLRIVQTLRLKRTKLDVSEKRKAYRSGGLRPTLPVVVRRSNRSELHGYNVTCRD